MALSKQGLTSSNWKKFNEILKMANPSQLSFMEISVKREQRKRRKQ